MCGSGFYGEMEVQTQKDGSKATTFLLSTLSTTSTPLFWEAFLNSSLYSPAPVVIAETME